MIAVDDVSFETAFSTEVEPWFYGKRKTGKLEASDGLQLHWYAVESQDERAALVVLPGWTEIAESLAETLYDLRESGLSFYVLEHRCQGLSGGEVEPRDRWYLKDWHSLVSDTELFVEKVVESKPHRKVIVFGNSMGGAIAASFLGRHPDAAQALVLVVPMFGIRTAPAPRFLALGAVKLLAALGMDTSYLPGYGPYHREPYEANSWLITSRSRYEYNDRLNQTRIEYRMGGATFRGAVELDRLCRASLAAARRIEVPTLLLQAGKERVVRNDMQDRAAALIHNCRKVVIEDAHHVVLREVDSVRDRVISAIRSFIEEQVE